MGAKKIPHLLPDHRSGRRFSAFNGQSVSDHIIVLQNGKIIEEGPAKEIFNFPKNEYTKNLIASIL